MIEQASLPKSFWAEAVSHAATIQNLFFAPQNSTTTSHELMKGTVPNISHLRTFGCLDWTHNPKERRKKLDSKSESGILVGCYENKQYKVRIPSRRTAIVARDAIINETVFPAREWSEEGFSADAVALDDGGAHIRNLANPIEHQPVTSQTPVVTTTQQTDLTQTNWTDTDQGDQPIALEEALTNYPDRRTTSRRQEGEQEEPAERVGTRNPTDERRYPLRNRAPASFYQPVIAELSTAFVATVHGDELSTVREALSMHESEQWKTAIRSELNSLRNHAT